MHRRVRHLNPAQCGARIALDARFITGVSDGAALDTWASRPPATATATQTGSARPTYNTAIVNGRPAVTFDATDDSMSFDATGRSTFQSASSGMWMAVALDLNPANPSSLTKSIVFYSTEAVAANRDLISMVSITTSGIRGLYAYSRRIDTDSFRSIGPIGSIASLAVIENVCRWSSGDFFGVLNGAPSAATAFPSGAGTTSASAGQAANLCGLVPGRSPFEGRICAVVGISPIPSQALVNRMRHHFGFSFRIATH